MDDDEVESSVGRFVVQRFNGSDYRRWSAKMRATMMGIGAWRIITGELQVPGESALPKEVQSYQRVNEKGFAMIYNCLEERYQMLLDEETCCKAAWKLLKDNFDMDSRARLVRQLDEFFSIKFEPEEETIGMFINRVKQAATRCNESKHKIDDLYISFQLIRKLPDEFSNVVIDNPKGAALFKTYKQEYELETDMPIEDSFSISINAVKKQARVFKSVLKLDKNFHIYFHRNRDLI